jgi:hypothetical protein
MRDWCSLKAACFATAVASGPLNGDFVIDNDMIEFVNPLDPFR